MNFENSDQWETIISNQSFFHSVLYFGWKLVLLSEALQNVPSFLPVIFNM
jgi:hypothetical protein